MISMSVVNIFNKFMSKEKRKTNDLYIVWAGGNDIASYISKLPFYLLNTTIDFTVNLILPPEEKLYQDYKQKNNFIANDYIVSIVKRLNDNGANYIIVPNLFDTGIVPQQLSLFQNMINIVLAAKF